MEHRDLLNEMDLSNVKVNVIDGRHDLLFTGEIVKFDDKEIHMITIKNEKVIVPRGKCKIQEFKDGR